MCLFHHFSRNPWPRTMELCLRNTALNWHRQRFCTVQITLLTWRCPLWALWRSTSGWCRCVAPLACWCSGTRSDWTGWWRHRVAAAAARPPRQPGPRAQPGPTSRRRCCNTDSFTVRRHDRTHTKHLRMLACFFWVCEIVDFRCGWTEFLDSLALEDATDTFSRNVGSNSPYAA